MTNESEPDAPPTPAQQARRRIGCFLAVALFFWATVYDCAGCR